MTLLLERTTGAPRDVQRSSDARPRTRARIVRVTAIAVGGLARSERFELPTLGIEIRCSIQLSYERIGLFDVQTPGSDEATPFRHVAGCSHLAANFSIPPGGRRNGTVPLGGCFRRLVRVLFGRFFRQRLLGGLLHGPEIAVGGVIGRVLNPLGGSGCEQQGVLRRQLVALPGVLA